MTAQERHAADTERLSAMRAGMTPKRIVKPDRPVRTVSKFVLIKRKSEDEKKEKASKILVKDIVGVRGTSTPVKPVLTVEEHRAATAVKIGEAQAAKIAKRESPANKARLAQSDARVQRSALRANAVTVKQ